MMTLWEGKWPFSEISLNECSLIRPFPSEAIRALLNRSTGFEVIACEKDGSPSANDWCILVVFETNNPTTGFAYARWGIIANDVQNFFETDGRVFGVIDETTAQAKVSLNASGQWSVVEKGRVKS
ncbi:MAG: hypothetical protein WC217_01025 [Candidatus Paceibacterota bacterium]|jgi:hypothetical protein